MTAPSGPASSVLPAADLPVERSVAPLARARVLVSGLGRVSRPSLPSGRLAVLVWTYVLLGAAMLVWLTAAVPLSPSIAVPFDLLGLDPGVMGVAIWIAVGIATSSRGSADEGRVTIIFGVAPVVASFALGGPTAAIWVAAIGSLEWREISGRVPWYGVLANHAMIMIPAGLGGIVTLALLSLGIGHDAQLGNLMAVAAGALTFCVINIALAVLTVYVRTGRRPSDALGVPWRAIATMMTAESALAWVFAATYVSLAWWSPVVLVFADAAASSSIDRSRANWLLRHDQLTHLPNRLALNEHARELRRIKSAIACVFYIDLDGFKAVNDTFDHQVGDDVLREVAGRLATFAGDGDFLGHLHGDEFVLVVDGLKSEEEAAAMIRDLTWAVERPIDHAEGAIRVSASIGHRFLTDSGDMEAALRDADRSMANAKQARAIASGRDRRRA
ncbi:MAG: GGDEF domain-containing protein [Chloroflexota bacterium]|nr:MAG: GGDEF domain-containing protein [Chloroflexota bacterium]